MEYWDLYTKYRERTGRTHIRGEELPEGLYHLAVHVWIRNSRGQYLISQRAASRPTYPLMWECPGGSVLQGEDSIAGAIREVREEVGIELLPEQGKLLFTKIRDSIDGVRFGDFMDAWLFEYDGEPMLDQATTEEVADCRWMGGEEIQALYDQGKLVPTLDYFFCGLEAEEPDYSDVIGTMVSGTIDRPLGSRHPRKPSMVYPINYGYVNGVLGGDGAEQDVYVFGTEEPLCEFSGKVIGVYRRFDDVEDKWIISLEGEEISDEKILGDIAFQEQFFYGKLYR